jgi:hypothetical protein
LSGSPVDVRGPAVDVVERMNIASHLRQASIRLNGMSLLDSRGRRVARVDIATLRSSFVPKDMELAAAISPVSSMRRVPTPPTTSSVIPSKLSSRTQRGSMSLSSICLRVVSISSSGRGLHSIVRRLAFGPDSEFVRHAGLYAATIPLAKTGDAKSEMFMLNTPGKLVALHPSL